MTMIRENCENCVGPTREACDAIYASVRERSGEIIEQATDLALSDNMVGIMELEQSGQASGEEIAVAIRGLGCTLNPMQLTAAFLSESMAGLQLKAAEIEEEEQAELEAARTTRIEGLLEEANDLIPHARKMLAEAQAEAANAMQDAAEAYCTVRGLDITDLDFTEKLELKAHLRELGFKP